MSRIRHAAWVILGIAALSLTRYLGNYDLYNLTLIASLAITVIGLNLLLGRLGSISAGQGALMGVGGYCTVLLVTKEGLAYPIAIVLATAASAVAGLLIGLPGTRIRGTSLAIVTLGLAIVFPEFLSHFSSITGGPTGVTIAPIEAPAFTGLDSTQWMYLLTVSVLLAAMAGYSLITTSPFGRGMDAVRSSVDLAASCGVATARTGVLTFAVSAAYAGLGGSLYQLTLGAATPGTYSFSLSLSLIFASVIGGLRTSAGAVVGAAFIVLVPTYAASLGPDVPQLIYAILLLTVIYGVKFLPRLSAVLPSGIREGGRTRLLVRAAEDGEEALPHQAGSAQAETTASGTTRMTP